MRKILIVDDTPMNLIVLSAFLKSPSNIVFVADSGKEAIRIAEEQQPDVILLDIMMPEMDGFETCERLKSSEATKQIPIIFVTSYDSPAVEAKSFSIGGYAFIKRPLTEETYKMLMTAIEDSLMHHKAKKNLQEIKKTLVD